MADEKGVKVSASTGRRHHFVLTPRIECSELSGPHFDFDSTFIRPEGMAAIGRIVDTVRSKPSKKAAIFGHTDAVGDEVYNKKLSEARARLVFGVFTHDLDPWEERSQAEHWGPRTLQIMLNAVQDGGPDGRLVEDGVVGPRTDAALKQFQTGAGLKPDGDAGPATRRQLFFAYMQTVVVEPLDPGQFIDVGGAKYMGCGEYNPFTAAGADDASRRVVVILFSPEVAPAGLPCALGDTGPCQGQLRDKDAPPPAGDRTPHFRCKVYRGLAERCPAGPGIELMPFRVQLHDEVYNPCGSVPYRLTLPSGSVVNGKTDANGWLRNAVPKGKSIVTVAYTPEGHDFEVRLRVRLTDAEPGSDDALLCHLYNFGFAHDDGRDRGMLLRFQSASQLETSGVLDDATRDAIRKIVDGGDDSLRDAFKEETA